MKERSLGRIGRDCLPDKPAGATQSSDNGSLKSNQTGGFTEGVGGTLLTIFGMGNLKSGEQVMEEYRQKYGKPGEPVCITDQGVTMV
jgi:hypothetical protein